MLWFIMNVIYAQPYARCLEESQISELISHMSYTLVYSHRNWYIFGKCFIWKIYELYGHSSVLWETARIASNFKTNVGCVQTKKCFATAKNNFYITAFHDASIKEKEY